MTHEWKMVWGMLEMDDVFFGVANGQVVGFCLSFEFLSFRLQREVLVFLYVLVFTHDEKLSFGESLHWLLKLVKYFWSRSYLQCLT